MAVNDSTQSLLVCVCQCLYCHSLAFTSNSIQQTVFTFYNEYGDLQNERIRQRPLEESMSNEHMFETKSDTGQFL